MMNVIWMDLPPKVQSCKTLLVFIPVLKQCSLPAHKKTVCLCIHRTRQPKFFPHTPGIPIPKKPHSLQLSTRFSGHEEFAPVSQAGIWLRGCSLTSCHCIPTQWQIAVSTVCIVRRMSSDSSGTAEDFHFIPFSSTKGKRPGRTCNEAILTHHTSKCQVLSTHLIRLRT